MKIKTKWQMKDALFLRNLKKIIFLSLVFLNTQNSFLFHLNKGKKMNPIVVDCFLFGLLTWRSWSSAQTNQRHLSYWHSSVQTKKDRCFFIGIKLILIRLNWEMKFIAFSQSRQAKEKCSVTEIIWNCLFTRYQEVNFKIFYQRNSFFSLKKEKVKWRMTQRIKKIHLEILNLINQKIVLTDLCSIVWKTKTIFKIWASRCTKRFRDEE